MKSAREKWAIGILLMAAILIAYWHVQYCDFVGFDDELYVTENPKVQQGLSVKGVAWAFTTFDAANWHPVTWLSHMLDVDLFGLRPMGHHWTSLQLHLINSLLLFMILNRLTGATWRSAFVAALFGLHPLHVESVAWVAERKDVLSAFFGFLAIGAYDRYAENRHPGLYAMVFLFLCLGLMTKPILVTFPFVLLLMDIWPLGRWDLAGRLEAVEPRRLEKPLFLILEKIPLMIPVTASVVLTLVAQKSGGAMGTLAHFPMSIRIGNALSAYAGYIGKFVWPQNLTVFYPHPGFSLTAWQVGIAALFILGISIFALLAFRRYPYVAVGWLFYLGTLVPVIGLVQVGEQAMADRYTYISLIGIFIIVTWGGVDLISYGSKHSRGVLSAAGIGIVLTMSFLTWSQVAHWENGVTLFQNAIKVTGDTHWAHNNLGTAYGKLNDPQKALFHYRESLRLKPDYGIALYNLGTTLAEQGDLDGAAYYLNRALELDAEDTDILNNLANILSRSGREESAKGYYRDILRMDPDNADVHSNLANVLMGQGRMDEAAYHYQEAIRLDPDNSDAHYNYGTLLVEKQEIEKAFIHFSMAIGSDSGNAKAYNAIGVLLARQGQADRAARFFRKALQVRPDYENPKKNLELLNR